MPTSNDRIMYNYCINSNLPFIVVCNKADKIAPTKVNDSVGLLKDPDIKLLLRSNSILQILSLSFLQIQTFRHHLLLVLVDKYLYVQL